MTEPSPVAEDELGHLQHYLQEMRRISGTITTLEQDKKRLQEQALPLLKRVGSFMTIDPTDGAPKIFNVRAPETLQVDASELYEHLVAHFRTEFPDDEETAVFTAEMVWKDCLKPPAIDTKEGGLFHQACAAGLIPAHVIAAVSKYKPSAEHVGFSKAGG